VKDSCNDIVLLFLVIFLANAVTVQCKYLDTFLFSALDTVGGQQEGHRACKMLGVDMQMVVILLELRASELLMFQSSDCHYYCHHHQSVAAVKRRFGLVYWCSMTLSAQTGYIRPQEYEIYYVGVS